MAWPIRKRNARGRAGFRGSSNGLKLAGSRARSGVGGWLMPYRKILVPVDYSPSSVQAFAEAVKLARALGSRLSVLHVRPAPTGSGTTSELSVPVESEAANTTFHGLLDAARKELG